MKKHETINPIIVLLFCLFFANLSFTSSLTFFMKNNNKNYIYSFYAETYINEEKYGSLSIKINDEDNYFITIPLDILAGQIVKIKVSVDRNNKYIPLWFPCLIYLDDNSKQDMAEISISKNQDKLIYLELDNAIGKVKLTEILTG